MLLLIVGGMVAPIKDNRVPAKRRKWLACRPFGYPPVFLRFARQLVQKRLAVVVVSPLRLEQSERTCHRADHQRLNAIRLPNLTVTNQSETATSGLEEVPR
jgi:hypothetical protein